METWRGEGFLKKMTFWVGAEMLLPAFGFSRSADSLGDF